MGRIGLAFVLAVGLAFASLVAEAQPLAKTAKIGFVNIQSASLVAVNITALREGLRQLGYIEGQNIAIEYRFADGRLDRLPDLTADLLRAQVEVLIVGGTTPAQAVKKSTSTVPIIFVGASDPIEAGLVVSFARPGGNATGLSTAHEDGFAGKWVELLREVVPTAVRAGVIHNPSNPSNVRYWRDIQAAAHGLGVRSLEVRRVVSLDRVLITLAQEHNDGLIVATDPLLFAHRTRIVEAANQQKLAVVYGFREFGERGGLLSYGASLPEMYRRAATYVDKILWGAKPADLPVEQPTKFELVISMKTAKALGLTIPQSLLLRADQIIE